MKFFRSCKLQHLFYITPLDNCFCFQSNPNSVRNWNYPDRVTICDHNILVKLFEAILLYLSCYALGKNLMSISLPVLFLGLVWYLRHFTRNSEIETNPFGSQVISGIQVQLRIPAFGIHISIISLWYINLFIRLANCEIWKTEFKTFKKQTIWPVIFFLSHVR